MRAWTILLVALALAVPTLSGHGQAGRKGDREPSLMQKKLEHAQRVLEGIAVHDFDKISRNAEDLIILSKQAEWKVLQTPQYELHSNEFRRIADSLVKSARDKNLDAAALNYVEMTLSCVKCHKYVREVRMTRLD
jgi:hypothetical protein